MTVLSLLIFPLHPNDNYICGGDEAPVDKMKELSVGPDDGNLFGGGGGGLGAEIKYGKADDDAVAHNLLTQNSGCKIRSTDDPLIEHENCK